MALALAYPKAAAVVAAFTERGDERDLAEQRHVDAAGEAGEYLQQLWIEHLDSAFEGLLADFAKQVGAGNAVIGGFGKAGLTGIGAGSAWAVGTPQSASAGLRTSP